VAERDEPLGGLAECDSDLRRSGSQSRSPKGPEKQCELRDDGNLDDRR
jgi:hypothetical protein